MPYRANAINKRGFLGRYAPLVISRCHRRGETKHDVAPPATPARIWIGSESGFDHLPELVRLRLPRWSVRRLHGGCVRFRPAQSLCAQLLSVQFVSPHVELPYSGPVRQLCESLDTFFRGFLRMCAAE